MRLDLFLKLTRIIKQRTVAKQACDAGAVTVNGALVKPGTAIQQGDLLRIDLPNYSLEAEVLEVPQRGNISRSEIERYVKILQRQARDPRSYVFGTEEMQGPTSQDDDEEGDEGDQDG